MSAVSNQIDFGTGSNESTFGEFDALLDASRPRATRDAATPRTRPVSESLAFRVRIVETEADLLRVQGLRQAAYGHHLPALAATFGQPDPVDRFPDVTLFCAEDKATRRLVGAARIQTNQTNPLQIERSLVLPPERHGQLLAEISRLTVLPGYAHPVKLALVKAIQLFCVAMQIGGIVAASRPSLLRQYLSLGFSDLYGDERLVPMAHGGGLEHRVLFRDIVTCEADSRARGYPNHDFVFRVHHPDIAVFDSVDCSLRATARRRRLGLQPGRVGRRRPSRARRARTAARPRTAPAPRAVPLH